MAASKAGDLAQATRLFTDWVNGQPGGFDLIPAAMRAVHLDNGRTIPLLFAAPPPTPITCAQLGNIKVPVAVTKGQQARQSFRVIADTAARCIHRTGDNSVVSARACFSESDAGCACSG